MKRTAIPAAVMLVVACHGPAAETTSTPPATSTIATAATTVAETTTTLSVATRMLAESEDCFDLARSIREDTETLKAQESDPNYGMTAEDIARTETRLRVARERMEEVCDTDGTAATPSTIISLQALVDALLEDMGGQPALDDFCAMAETMGYQDALEAWIDTAGDGPYNPLGFSARQVYDELWRRC